MRQQVSKPVIAIGGITTLDKAFEVGQNGANYGAVVSALAQTADTRINATALGFALWLGQQAVGSDHGR